MFPLDLPSITLPDLPALPARFTDAVQLQLPWTDRPGLSLLLLAGVALITLLSIRAGWRAGASRILFTLAGAVAGLVVGVDLAGWAVVSPDRGYLLVLIVLAATVLGAVLGSVVGSALAGVLRRIHLQVIDRTAGAVLRGGIAVAVCLVAVSLLVPGAEWGPAAGLQVHQLVDAVRV